MASDRASLTSRRERLLTALTYVVLLILGAMLGVWGAFLVPLRLFGHVEGLADVVAFGGNLAAGYLAARGLGRSAAAAMPGLGWLPVAYLAQLQRPEGDLIVPGKLGDDPGIGTVGTLFLLGGLAGIVVALVLVSRRASSRPPDGRDHTGDQR